METLETLESLFHENLGRALATQRVDADPMTEHYLVTLLAGFAARPVDDTPLAVKLLASLDAAPAERRRALRDVGDTSLYVSGFFSESFARRIVDVDYYIGLGGSAYGELARSGVGVGRDPHGEVYQRLSHDFARFVGVIELVAQWLMPPVGPQDIVRLYDKFRQTGSSWAARKLAQAGVTPPRGGSGIQ